MANEQHIGHLGAKVKLAYDHKGRPVIKLVFTTKKAREQVAAHLTRKSPARA
jgi:hypothetical protein